MPEADRTGLATALRFLTILPLPGRAEVSERVLGRCTAWFPLAGALIGFWGGADYRPPFAIIAGLLIIAALIFRGFMGGARSRGL